jgi:phage regulator Rha-like protein
MKKNAIIRFKTIQQKIYTVRNLQVMLDKDLAELYRVEIKVFNQAVKRNIKRFPKEFMFQLTPGEYDSLRSQIVTLKKRRGQHRKYLPYVFTEQGVSMLASVLKSKTAIKVSIQIINAFVAMRKFITANARIFERLNAVERKQLECEIKTEKKFEKIFNTLENKSLEPKQGIFYDGQIFDAYLFVSGLVKKAKKSITIIDNYIDESVLNMLTKRKKSVKVKLLTKTISKQLALDVNKYNKQYPKVELTKFDRSHDRFMILDGTDIYHFGASLKDLGKKWFAFTRMEIDAMEMLSKLKKGR